MDKRKRHRIHHMYKQEMKHHARQGHVQHDRHFRRFAGQHRNAHLRKHWKHGELRRFHRVFRWLRPLVLLFNLFILYLLFRFFGIKTISLFLTLFIVLFVSMQLLFFRRVEKRILSPVDELIDGVRQIAEGNYDVRIENRVPNDIGSLIVSFNEMAVKLKEGERLKIEYEQNRKELIANISHDLKTPISSIQGYLEAVMDGMVSPDKVDAYLKTIYQNTCYTNKLIDDLFLFTKLDMQKMDFHFDQAPAGAFMQDLFDEFRFELEDRKCGFRYRDGLEEDVSFRVDGKRIQQAVRNIIGNAVKHGPEIGLSISVDLYRQEDMIRVDIGDNGPGISGDKLPHVFERFYRVDHARTKDLMSTGLGLAIAKELIEAHQGLILVESEEGRGTVFSMLLPVAAQAGCVEEGKEELDETDPDYRG